MRRAATIARLGVLVVLLAFLLSPRIQLSLTQESNAYLEVERGGNSDLSENAIDFDELSAEQQALFERALDGDRVQIPDDTDSSVWYEYDSVRYENETYAVLVIED